MRLWAGGYILVCRTVHVCDFKLKSTLATVGYSLVCQGSPFLIQTEGATFVVQFLYIKLTRNWSNENLFFLLLYLSITLSQK